MNKHAIYFLLLATLLVFESCKNQTQNKSTDFDIQADCVSVNTLALSPELEEDIIFYNMLYPIDMGKIIDSRNSFYNSALLNPLNNISNYNSSTQKALALGIYGADLSYLWVFSQNQQALSYFATIKLLADDLNIPLDYVKTAGAKAENYTGNIDTLVNIARQAYYDSEDYLMSNGNENLAILILLGGWIETLNTATHLYTQPNSRMAGKIISQKYSLSSLINLIYSQTNQETIDKYSKPLNELLVQFDEMQKSYLSDYLEIDTVNKTITFIEINNISIEPEQFGKIKASINLLRTQLIE